VAAVGIWNNTSWLVVDQTSLIGDLDGWTGLDRRGQHSRRLLPWLVVVTGRSCACNCETFRCRHVVSVECVVDPHARRA
jgi:hypothetical protein